MKKLITGLIVVVLVVGLAWWVASILGKPLEPQVGSVTIGGEYQATSTNQMHGGCTIADRDYLIQANVDSSNTTIVNNSTILGSITVASTTNHILRIKNATTTAGTVFTNSSSTVALLPAGIPAGTYIFDSILTKGLVLDFEQGFCGDYIITYR